MNKTGSIDRLERTVFRMSQNDGLNDMFLGCLMSQMAIAPFLSSRLGDFWSSAVFLPLWFAVIGAIAWLKKHVVVPRIGVVTYRPARRQKLARFTWVMLILNLSVFILGLIAAANVGKIPGNITSLLFGLMLLGFFSLGAYFLDVPRLYLYALMLGLSPPVGEWLYQNHGFSHHGFPVTFGSTAAVMFVTGLILFLRLLAQEPIDIDAEALEDGSHE